MKNKTKINAIVCLVLLAVLACGGLQPVLADSGNRIDPITAFKDWKQTKVSTIVAETYDEDGNPLPTLPNSNRRVCVLGTVFLMEGKRLDMDDAYILQGNDGARYEVVCFQSRPLPNDRVFILGVLKKGRLYTDDMEDRWYLQESYRWTYVTDEKAAKEGLDTPTESILRKWLNFDEFYALENSFRRFVVLNDCGERLHPLTMGDWEKFKNLGRVTTISEIEKHMDCKDRSLIGGIMGGSDDEVIPPTGLRPEIKRLAQPQSILLAGLGILILILFFVLLIFLLSRKGGGTQLPQTSDLGTMPASTPTSVASGTTTMSSMPPKQDSRITTVLEGKPVDPRATQVLSGYGLNVISGGKAAGEQHFLADETLIGRDAMDYMGYFLQLDMSDRPDKETFCSRKYVKLVKRPGDDGIFDVEVMNDSRNPVTVDGKTIRGRGETAMAKVGSRIKLMPDWEFELIKC